MTNGREFAAAIPTGRVCGVDIAAVTLDDAVETIIDAALRRTPLQVHLCNAYTLSLVDRDEELRRALEASDLNVPDGAPVAWLLRRLGVEGPIRGPDLVPAVVKRGVASEVRHYFWGGAKGVAVRAAARLQELAPGALVAGCESPPFRDLTGDEVSAVARRIRASGANVLWVGLGTPRQDYVVPRLSERFGGPVVPVGAAFDFLAGTVAEAPRFLRGTGLEWTYRLASEPKRLWRRYLLGNPRFVAAALRHRHNSESATQGEAT
jgi:N-acetylglucosaminyldiphosphoundecaprenol N-acetyl-beta-D-mannosaminyltransferase